MDNSLLQRLCQQYNALLLEVNQHCVRIAVAENPGAQMLETLRFSSQKTIEVELWSAEKLEKQRQHQPALAAENLSAVTMVDQLLQQALRQRASDIHLEPTEHGWRVRLRVDGVLHVLADVPDNIASLTARLKVLASLDIAERRLPQDGQFSIECADHAVSFRISTLPCRWGEKVVLRLLQHQRQELAINSLGMSEQQLPLFHQALQRPQGLILVSGPTGSGKTITLYSGLSQLNRPQVNMCSVEDPIEIPLDGLNQTQINPKAGLTFQRILRALLRQDPDIIMIGEIRDGETAEIALKAAQTGHLVLSTLHTISTGQTLTRLEQMGVARWLLASALELIIAQRLVRRLCPHCRQRQHSDHSLPARLWPRPLANWQAMGCERCYAGYYGRVALFELLPVNALLRQQIVDGLPARDMEQQAHQQGMVTLFEHGCQAVEQGLTTVEELWRVLGQQYD